MSTNDRPRGGRRPEEFPDARERDARVLTELRHNPAGLTRNQIALELDQEPRKISYALHRLRSAGKIRRVPRGNEGHGYWEAITESGS